jgi:hypothetical protein
MAGSMWYDTQALLAENKRATNSSKISWRQHLDSIRLVDTNPGEPYRYIALSHRWTEQTEKVCTTTSTIDQFKIGIRFDILPDQFQEAIRITRAIGIQYIWIDSLCIIQKEPDLADWNIESTKMADVYQVSRRASIVK